jgi:NAD(P)-dependent dehydrogenase (short-subunit alcohol dehydrogenase family)
VRDFIDGMPKRRLIQPEEVAETVQWLAVSPAARVFHGAVLDASMGLAVRPGLQTEQSHR